MLRLSVSENRRFLQRSDGSPFFYLADTVWELFHRADAADLDAILTDRASKGFTAIQAVALAEIDGLATPNRQGHRPLHDNDPTRPNDDYFAFVDAGVRRANELGLTLAMLPTWGDKWNPAWAKSSAVIFTPDNARVYGRFLGSRYKDADLIWVLGGDRPIQNETQLHIIRAMAEGLHEGDGGAHLMTFHPCGGTSSSQFVHPEAWLDFHMLQSGHARDRDNFAMIERDYVMVPTRPCLDGEPGYETHPSGFQRHSGWLVQDDIRKSFYWSVFAGACGYTYGCHCIWQMWEPGRDPINFPVMSWREALALPGSQQVGLGRRLLLSRPYFSRIPDQYLIAHSWGHPGHSEHARATRCAEGRYAMVYSPAGKAIKIRTGLLSGSQLQVWWFNPRDGSTRSEGTIPKQDETEFVPPFDPIGRDWILVLDDASQQFGPPGR